MFVNTQKNRDQIIQNLKTNTLNVEFVKTDGSIRNMEATLQPDIIIVSENKTDKTKTPNFDVQVVYDIKAKGWRSFRWDSVLNIENV